MATSPAAATIPMERAPYSLAFRFTEASSARTSAMEVSTVSDSGGFGVEGGVGGSGDRSESAILGSQGISSAAARTPPPRLDASDGGGIE